MFVPGKHHLPIAMPLFLHMGMMSRSMSLAARFHRPWLAVSTAWAWQTHAAIAYKMTN